MDYDTSLGTTFQNKKDFIFAKRPILKKIYDENKDIILLDFFKKQLEDSKINQAELDKKEELIAIISEFAGKRLGEDVQKSVNEQLRSYYFVSTSDHHGPITDPGFFTSNLLFGLANQETDSEILKNIIVLGCGNISFDNDSFPRGHLFHSLVNEEVITNQLVLFPRKARPFSVYHYKSYTEESIQNAKKRISELVQSKTISQQIADKLSSVIGGLYSSEKVLSYSFFSDQVTETNFTLWNKLFANSLPNLIYLEQEDIVNEVLLKKHLQHKTLIHDILFDHATQELIQQYFNGISNAFSIENQTGTFLFWALPKDQKYRVQLWRQANFLVANDGSYRIELKPETIEKAIRSGELFPSTLLSFITLSFYYGLTLFGGGAQTTYFTAMKEAYQKFLDKKMIATTFLDEIDTKKIALPYPSIAFIEAHSDSYIPATSLDFLIYRDEHSLEQIKKMSKNITVGQVILRTIPTLYRFISEDKEIYSSEQKEVDEVLEFSSAIKIIGKLSNN